MKSKVGVLIFMAMVIVTLSYSLLSKSAAQHGVIQAKGDGPVQISRKRITGTLYPQVKRYDDARSLAAESQSVIIGVPVFQASHTSSPSSRLVWTDYRVKVLSVLKGEVSEGELISVRTQGGKMNLPDGTEVETQMPEFWKSPLKGQGYVFFLTKQREASQAFKLTGGPQGLFLISPWNTAGSVNSLVLTNEVVVPQVRPTDGLTRDYQGMKATSFVKAVAGYDAETGK